MIKFLIFSIAWAFLIALPVKADFLSPKFVFRSDYKTGAELCEEASALISNEHGHFLQVPVKYNDPQLGKTTLYYRLAERYDPYKPTMIYFNGGPGEASHLGLFSFLGAWNVIMFDQRGIGCSRPDSYALYSSPSFYSSESTARDAYEIIKDLGIKKVSVYGLSYGTVPATIFANLFAEATNAVILEGVVYQGDETLWSAPHRRKILQKMINSLTFKQRNYLASFGTENNLPAEWFSFLARNTLLENRGLEKLKALLQDLPNQKYSLVKQFKQLKAPKPPQDEYPLFIMDNMVYAMIGCQELGMLSPGAIPFDWLKGSLLVPGQNLMKIYCDTVGVRAGVSYDARKYPLKVPVTYLQGAIDSATEASSAILHYKNVAKGPAQLLIMTKGGHNPNLSMILNGSLLQASIFDKALVGESVTEDMIADVKQVNRLFWAKTSKNGL